MSTVSTGFSAAEESVKMIDGILGSNETSRALSSIITLVRQELTQDPRFTPAERGAISSLTALTKAITAFACLQSATHKRTLKEMRLRVVYDCTIVMEGQSVETDYIKDSPIKSHFKRRSESSDSIMTDVRTVIEAQSRSKASSEAGHEDSGEEGGEMVEELQDLIGVTESGDEETSSELPEEVRMALRDLEDNASGGGVRVVRSPRFNYEIQVEETTTTTTTTVRTRESTAHGSPARTIARTTKVRPIDARNLFPVEAVQDTSMSPNASDALSNMLEGEVVDESMQEDEWVEVSTTVENSEDENGDDEELNSERESQVPYAENGKQSLASTSRQSTIDHPEEGRQRLQVSRFSTHFNLRSDS